jgi:hypothetical protein
MIESECRISWEIDEAILPIAAILLGWSIPLCLLRREDLFEPTSLTIDSAIIKAPSLESEKLNLNSFQLSAIFTWSSLRCPKADVGQSHRCPLPQHSSLKNQKFIRYPGCLLQPVVRRKLGSCLGFGQATRDLTFFPSVENWF